MKKMILKDNSRGYERLKVGQIYDVIEEEGIFKINPYVKVYDEKGEQIATAHKSRFEEVEK